MIKASRMMQMFALLSLAQAAQAETAEDAAVREVEARQEAAWNAHDARAYAALFTEDADLVSATGHRISGRAEIERDIAAAFQSIFAHNSLHIDDVSVRPLGDDLVLAHVDWSSTDSETAALSGRRGVQTQVLRKSDGRWLILAYHNSAMPPAGSARESATGAAPPAREERDDRPCLVANTSGRCLIHKGRRPADH
jgi:uncharacterized protein (TIGR02246 family)